MYTAEMARRDWGTLPNVLDARIEEAVKKANYNGFRRASIRVYINDPFLYNIREELENRGFTDIDIPDICLSGDVEFRW